MADPAQNPTGTKNIASSSTLKMKECIWKDMANAMSFFRHNRIDKNALVK